MKKAGIYKLTNKINGKSYIGKSIDLRRRLNRHKLSRHNQVICRAIRKYGWENFEVEILQDYDIIDNNNLLALETAFIDFFDSTNPTKGYNVCLFANSMIGYSPSKETRLKLSKALKGKFSGEKSHLWRKSPSVETREKMSAIRLGKPNPKNQSIDSKQKQSAKMKGRYSREKSYCFDDTIFNFQNTSTLESFRGTVYDFRKQFGLTKSGVSALKLGKIKHHLNWIIIDFFENSL